MKKGWADGELNMMFNYLGLWGRCYDLFVQIAKAHGATLIRMARSVQTLCFPEITHEVLWQAAGLSKKDRQRSLLYRIAPLLQDIIDNHGDEYMQEARSVSSGHIPRGQRPCDQWQWGSNDADEASKRKSRRSDQQGPAPCACILELDIA